MFLASLNDYAPLDSILKNYGLSELFPSHSRGDYFLSDISSSSALYPAAPFPQSSGESVAWANAVGVAVSGNNLTKTAAFGWGNAGATSTKNITSGDGYVEFTASETNLSRMGGLSNGDTDQNWQDIDFAIYAANDSNLYLYEAGNYIGGFGPYAAGDTLRIGVEGGVVKFR